jgi:hypothetical protein
MSLISLVPALVRNPFWKDADPGIPILQQAKAEYAKPQ